MGLEGKVAVFSSLLRIGSRIAAHTPLAYRVVVFIDWLTIRETRGKALIVDTAVFYNIN